MFRYLYFYRNFNYFFVNYIFKLPFCLQYYHLIMPIKLLFINNSTICLQEQRIGRSGKCFSEEPFNVSLEVVGEEVIYLYFLKHFFFSARFYLKIAHDFELHLVNLAEFVLETTFPNVIYGLLEKLLASMNV